MSPPTDRRTVLITGATGDTGRAAVRESLPLGLQVRAMVHKKDARSDALEKLGAEVVIGDLLEINTVRAAMEGVDAAYFVWPVQPGLIHATVNFAEAAKEAGVKTAINLSQRSANRDSTSNSCRDSFIAEQVFNWSGLSVIHLRPTYFLEWLLYPSPIPSFRRRQKPAEQPAADQHFREPLHQRHQPMVGHVRDQFVEHAPLAE
jgi:NAD(P)H dehydrogenase (quinone)